MWLAQAAGLALVYALTGYAGLLLPHYTGHFALIWLPAGIAVFAFLRWGLGFWPAVLAGSGIVSALVGTDLVRSLVMAVFNTVGPVLTVWLLRRWRFDAEFRRARDLLGFVSAVLIGMCIMASGGTVGLWLRSGPHSSLLDAWITWWLGDCTGVFLVTPFLLSLRPSEWRGIVARRWEFLVWGVLAIGLGGVIFLHDQVPGNATLPLAFLVLPLAAWAGMRFGLLGMSLGVLLICGLALLGLAMRVGPFVQPERSLELLHMTLFLLSVILVGWLVMGLQRERDLSERRLREDRESIELATRGSSDGFWDWNVVTDEVYHPQRWLAKLGYGIDDYPRLSTGAGWLEIVHPEDRERAKREVDRHLRERTPYAAEYRMRTKAGTYRWFLARGQAVWDEQGRVVRMAGSHTDITDRLAEQERLRLLELCLSRSNDVVMISATGGSQEGERIVYVNEAFARETGYPAQEAIGRHPRFLEGSEAPDDSARLLEAAFRNREPVRVERVHYRKDGAAFWVEVDMVPVKDGKGHCTHFVSVQRDITARKREEAERTAREEQVRAAQRFETLGTLAGGFAHHFNNLLTGINGYIELARETLPEGHLARQDLEAALQGGQAAASLVSRVLAYARHLPETKSLPIDLNALVSETLPLLEVSVSSSVRFEQHYSPTPQWILGDAGRLQQVLINLGVNAAQSFGSSVGVVRVTVRGPDEAALGLARRVCLEVADEGCGMDSDVQKRIFDPFYTTKPPGQGTGLGLSVVQGIVVNHGGEIQVTSAPGVGSTFSVYFPGIESPHPPESAHATTGG